MLNSSVAFIVLEITAILGIAVIAYLVVTIRKNNRLLQKLCDQAADESTVSADRFSSEKAEKMLEKDEVQALMDYCEKHIKGSPNSVSANWYYALSLYSKKEYDVAREYFEKVIELNPLWRDGAQVYLQDISEKSPKKHNPIIH